MVSNHVLLGGVPEGFDAMAIEKEAGKGGVIYIARDANRMQALRSAFAFFAPKVPVYTFPAWDCLPYDRASPSADISAQRVSSLTTFMALMPESFVVLTTIGAACQRVPSRENIKRFYI